MSCLPRPRITMSTLTMHRLTIVLLACTPILSACDLIELDHSGPPPSPVVPDPVRDLADEVEQALVEKLECDETLRPSTLERLRDVLHDPTASELQALLLNPQDLATVVSMAGPQVEAPVVVAQNLLRVVGSGAGAELLANGWSGVSCGEPVVVSCTAGNGSSTVGCNGSVVTSIELAFEGCTLQGTVYDGAVALLRVIGDDAVATLAIDKLAIDETQVLDGSLALDLESTLGAFDAALSAPDVLSIVDHGGLAAGLECSAETTFERAGFLLDADNAVIALKASRAEPDQVVGVETFGEHLSFGAPTDCACPLPGSGVLVDVPRPLGRSGEAAHARITWAAEATACSVPHVVLEDWPTSCAGLEDVDGDCARAATTATLEGLLGALCAP